MAPTFVNPCSCAYWSTGAATIGAAGKQVRKVYRLSRVRAASVPDFTRKRGICSCSATAATGAPTPLEMMPPTATTPSSISRSKRSTPTSALFSESWTTSSIIRPLTPPASLISCAARAMPSRTLTPQGVKPVRSVSVPILIGSVEAGSVAGASVGASVAGASVAGASVAGASVSGASVAGAAVSAGATHAVRIITTERRMGMILQVIPYFLFILPPISKVGFLRYR